MSERQEKHNVSAFGEEWRATAKHVLILFRGFKSVMLWFSGSDIPVEQIAAVTETVASALQIGAGWLVRAEMGKAIFPTVPATALSNTRGLNVFIMCLIQNYYGVKVLGFPR